MTTSQRKPRTPFEEGTGFVVLILFEDHPKSEGEAGWLPFDLRSHEYCHASWGKYFVMVAPNADWNFGLEVVACLSPMEALYFTTEVISRRLSFISENPVKFPTTGYLIEADALSGPRTRNKFHNPVRAMRVIMDDVCERTEDVREPWFDFGILDLGCIRGWKCILNCSGLWQTEIWSQCVQNIPDSSLEPTQAVKDSDPHRPFERFPKIPIITLENSGVKQLYALHTPVKLKSAMDLLSLPEKRLLAVSFLHNFWESCNATQPVRAEQLKWLQLNNKIPRGRAAPKDDDRGAFSNLMADAGLRNRNPRKASEFFNSVQHRARGFFSAKPESLQDVDLISRHQFEYGAVKFLVPIIQPAFHSKISYSDIAAFERPR